MGSVVLACALIFAVDRPVGGTFRTASLLDPVDGLWRTARMADHVADRSVAIAGLGSEVRVVRDDRGVPHIFAGSDEDAVRAFGYVVAQDRLFQMDFLRRYTSGRLSEVMGVAALPVDRAMRQTGLVESVQRNLEASRRDGRITASLFSWFADGVNAYLDDLDDRDLPFEFRLFDYTPDRFTAMDPGLIGWNLVYDLTYERERPVDRSALAALFPPGEFDRLFPRDQVAYEPIIPPEEAWWAHRSGLVTAPGTTANPVTRASIVDPSVSGTSDGSAGGMPASGSVLGDWGVGFHVGKGSNNWAVSGSRSTTGAPILAGDMHLSLTLPSIWYEVHLVTPTMDTYGVTVPGVPLPIEAFNRRVGWAFTNTGSDQIDHLALELDDSGFNYRYEEEWLPLSWEPVEYHVRGAEPVTDSIAWSHWGPVSLAGETKIAVRWVGNDTLRTFDALWAMNHADGYEAFEDAIRVWDSPMQNILYAGLDGQIAIRSTGYLPIRADGGAPGLRDGSTRRSEWIGRVPFEDLPHAINPARGYLTSTNQQPAESSYPYYLGSYGPSAWRSLRIDDLLSARALHSPSDIASYQADAVAVAAQRFIEVVRKSTFDTDGARRLQTDLTAWDGTMSATAFEPYAFDLCIDALERLTWDEPVFDRRRPSTWALLDLLEHEPDSPWFDAKSTPRVEKANDLLGSALSMVADSLDSVTGSAWERATWGDHHELVLRHITMTPALSVLWRGPFPFDGTNETLSVGPGRRVTFGASWRVVLDFSGDRPTGRGIYAGGASGNPFSRRYDLYMDDFLGFGLRVLPTPSTPEDLDEATSSGALTLRPNR